MLLLLGAGEGLKALGYDVVQGNLLRDEAVGGNLALAHEADDVIEVVAAVADGAHNLLLRHADLVKVEGDRLLPNRSDDNRAARVNTPEQLVNAGFGTRALKRNVGAVAASRGLDGLGHVAVGWVDEHVGAGILCVLLTNRLTLHNDNLRSAHGLQALDGGKADSAGASHNSRHARLEVARFKRVVTNGDWLHQCGLVVGKTVGNLVDELVSESRVLGKATALAREAVEAEIRAEVGLAGLARRAGIVADDRLHDNTVAGLDVGDAGTDLDHLAGELVAHDDRRGLARHRMRGASRDKDGAGKIFMQVRTADTTPVELYLDVVLLVDLTLRDVLDADVPRLVPKRCLHCCPSQLELRGKSPLATFAARKHAPAQLSPPAKLSFASITQVAPNGPRTIGQGRSHLHDIGRHCRQRAPETGNTVHLREERARIWSNTPLLNELEAI